MKKSVCLFFLLWITFFSIVSADEKIQTEGSSFQGLVGESGMSFSPPEGFHAVDAVANPLFPYEHAVRNQAETLEIRYAIRPLSRLKIDYDDPHGSAPDPNHVFPLMFQSLVTRLSNGTHSPTRVYPPEQADEKFHAHWAAASVFDIHREFSDQFQQALLIAMHKNHMADAYAIFLFDDYALVKDKINGALGALAFLP